MNVLIADDDDSSCKLLQAALEAEGDVVMIASDGQKALELLKLHPVDVIISELLMPNMDGYRLCWETRQDRRWREVPFICYTSNHGSDNDEKLAIDLGADAYLRKPASSSTILNVLRASIERVRGRPGGSEVSHLSVNGNKPGYRYSVPELEKEHLGLVENEELLCQLGENISDAFWITDLGSKKALFVSPVYEKIWGRSCQSFLAQPESFKDAIHPEDRVEALNTLQSGSTGPYELEYRIVRPDSSIRWIRNRAFPIRKGAGPATRVVTMAEDVTEKREWEMQLRQSQKMQAIGRLAGGVAHDFNNLLAVIFGHSALLAASEPSPERLRDSLVEINRAAERGAALTRQLLAFGRRQMVEPKVLDLGSVLAESRILLERLLGKEVRLTMILSPGLSRVNIDPGQINQVLMNLASNAREAMPDGGELTVETREVNFDAAFATKHPDVRPGPYVLLAVTDNGCGMTPEVQSRVFEPFFSTKGESTGLGLSVVDGIVKQNGGHLTMLSRQLFGTTFSIFLPAVEEPLDESVPHAPSKPFPGNEIILLVEDEDPVREVTALLLESLGYQVLQVSGAEEALSLVRTDEVKVDLLLTDVIMPGMSGRELADAFRLHDPGIKVLFQSGHTDDVIVRHGILNSEVAFLQKPFSIDALAKKVRGVFNQK